MNRGMSSNTSSRRVTFVIALYFALVLFGCTAAPIQTPLPPAPTQTQRPTRSVTEVYARETQRVLATQAYYRSVRTPTDELIATLQHGDSNARIEAIKTLALRNEARAAEALISALQDPDGNIRVSASQNLSLMGDAAVEPLIAALKDPATASNAAGALGEIGDTRAVEPLIALLKDETSQNRDAAAVALGKLGDPRAVDPLIAFLRDATAWNRNTAALALGEIGDPQAIEPLLAALAVENDQNTCHSIIVALDYFKDPRAIEAWLNTVREKRCYLDIRYLAAYGEAAVQPLVAALKEEDWQVQNTAVDALMLIGDPAIDPMMAVYAAQDWKAVAVACNYYVALGREGTEPGLITALETYGDSSMAVTFLNSGNEALYEAAKKWGDAHGYIITGGPGSPQGPGWGDSQK